MLENHSLTGNRSPLAEGPIVLTKGSLLAGSSFLSESYGNHFNTLREVYNRALTNHHFESLLVYSGEIKNRFQDDMPSPFFINLQFKAIVPITNLPESWIIWCIGKKPLLLLYQPETVWDAVAEMPDTFGHHTLK